MSKRRRKKRQGNNKGLSMIAFVVVVFCLVLFVRVQNLKSQSEELAEKKASIEKQIQEEEKRTKELEELKKYMQTKKYMEEVAKEKLGLVYPDEILIEPSND
ncbi:MAG: septum formation initiator family protein [Lachnospiraceae bacterium]|nr:septum formation initiator family protein [Lachnospiraceae bacterium]